MRINIVPNCNAFQIISEGTTFYLEVSVNAMDVLRANDGVYCFDNGNSKDHVLSAIDNLITQRPTIENYTGNEFELEKPLHETDYDD